MSQEETFVKIFTTEMKKRRKEKSLSLKQLEQLTGVNASFINRLENRQRKNLGVIGFLQLSKALEIDFCRLLEMCEEVKMES